MKNILVPTDFSEQAENALEVAAQIAREHNCEIYLLHMLELPLELINPADNDTSSNDLPEAIFFMKLAHQKFSAIMKKEFLKDIKVHETVEFHEAFDGIMEISKKHGCDLIVMGSSGSKGAKELFIGSNTEKVVRHSDIPVLVIKKKFDVFKVNKVLYATNLATETASSFLEAKRFANNFKASMEVVFVNTAKKFKTSEEIEKRREVFYDQVGATLDDIPFTVRNQLNMEDGIVKYAEDAEFDVICIGTHGRKGISRFINGSLSEDLVNHAKIPVVAFKIG